MQEITLNNQKYLGIIVPKVARDPWIINNGTAVNWYNPSKEFDGNTYSDGTSIPKGEYEIIGILETMSDIECEDIIHNNLELYTSKEAIEICCVWAGLDWMEEMETILLIKVLNENI